jgi:hypothetical protein
VPGDPCPGSEDGAKVDTGRAGMEPPSVATIASWMGPLGAWGGPLVAPLLYPLQAWWTAYPIYSLTLVLKAPDVFFMTRGIGHHDVPFHPDLEGKRLEFDHG